ncbi:hypothetical protein K1W69_11255 [Hoeflea sp. WL0058]|uniref:3-deoxy-D-manno-octulosonic acid transferase n=1 Tax=Flavimaribacter sediminis TaxID=2865987 RepID=A0AAE2ZNE9_9HYPH|nr:glycosyltransferase N-terminal domain-containing protein [Flavimaribacter sediminis]MBW8637765.1 hypothetical protein [Flavimaribacter sediminis]
MSLALAGWRLCGPALAPLLERIDYPNDQTRKAEKRGVPGLQRPVGRVIWFHGVSAGEIRALQTLCDRVERILRSRSGDPVTILLTTRTISGAQMVASFAGAGVIHQYAPVDVDACVERFLDYWDPDLAVFAENEIWPATKLALRRRGVPIAIVNAALDPRSSRVWRTFGTSARPVFEAIDLVVVRHSDEAAAFRRLGVRNVLAGAELKVDAPDLPADPDELARLKKIIGDRPVWLAASVHPGEEIAIARTHQYLLGWHPDLLTIVAPRRLDESRRMIGKIEKLTGHSLCVRSVSGPPGKGASIYFADTFGELGLFFRIAPIVLMGGSYIPKGGHNPYEPAKFGAALLHGPHVRNFERAYRDFGRADACLEISKTSDIGPAIDKLLTDSDHLRQMGEAAKSAEETLRQAVRETTNTIADLLVDLSLSKAAGS